MPALYRQVRSAARRGFSKPAIAAFYRSVEKESIDYGIMEKSGRVSAVAGTFFWDDIGSWESLTRIFPQNRRGTTVVGDRVFEQECERSIVVNKSAHTLAAVGCSNIAVVATPDAVLVMDRSRLPDLKKYLGEMKKDKRFPSTLF
jgi:mannose-1-phosphate guanylyltransferase